MRDRHTHEVADAKWLIKKGLTSELYLYEISESSKRFKYIVVNHCDKKSISKKGIL